VFTKTSRGILTQSPIPDDILEVGTEKLSELMKDLSRNQINVPLYLSVCSARCRGAPSQDARNRHVLVLYSVLPLST
jgi:hypothetical protein